MLSFTVEPVEINPRSPITTIRGTKEQGITDILVNGIAKLVRFPTSTTWEYDYVLLPYNVFNYLDDWGLQLSTPRLPGEKNQYYLNRLLHAERYKGGPIYEELIEAVRRELSLDSIEEALTISLPQSSSSNPYPVTKKAYVSVTPTAVLIEADSLVVSSETVLVDPGTREAELDYRPRSKEDIQLVTSSGDKIPQEDIELIDTKKIRVHNSPLRLKATYTYLLEFKHKDNVDLNTLSININSSTNTSSQQVVVATVNSSATSYKPKYLKRTFREEVTSTSPLNITAYNFRVVELFDKEFQDELLDENKLFYGTKLERYANDLNDQGNIFLYSTILDKDSFIDERLPRNFSALPFRFDSYISYFRNKDDTTDTKKYSYWEYKWYSGSSTYPNLEQKGVRYEDIVPGPGIDLTVVDIEEV